MNPPSAVLILLLLAALTLTGQPKTTSKSTSARRPAPPTKEESGPKRHGYLVSRTLIFQDEGCAADYVAATNMSGVAKRKALEDILHYQCAIFTEEGWIYAVSGENAIGGKPATSFVKGLAIIDVDLTRRAYGKLPGDIPKNAFPEGLILDSAISDVSEDEMIALIDTVKK